MDMVFVWWAMLELFGLIGLPIVAWLFPGLRDRGWSLAKLTGLLLVAYPVWVLNHFGPFFGTAHLVLWILLWGGVAILFFFLDLDNWKSAFRRPWEMAASEAIWILLFLGLAILRSYSPDIVGLSKWGGCEKFMDLNFVNSILNSAEFPPRDNWLAGYPINYYYYAYYLCAVLIQLTGALPHVGYNLMLVTVYALAAHGLWGLLRNLRVSWWWVVLAIFLAFFSSNLKTAQMIRESESGRLAPHLAMSTSRVIDLPTDRTINEYPLFSFMWGDLHGHLTGMAFQMVLLGLFWGSVLAFLRRIHPLRQALGLLVIAIVFGSAVTSNAWDLPAYATLWVFSIFAATSLTGSSLNQWKGVALQGIGRVAAVAAVFLFLFAPFFNHFVPPTQGHNNLPLDLKSPINLFLQIFGPHFLLLVLPLIALIVTAFRATPSCGSVDGKDPWLRKTPLFAIAAVGSLVLLIGSVFLWSRISEGQKAATPILLLFLLVLAGIWLFARWVWKGLPEDSFEIESVTGERFVAFLLFLGIGLLLGCEFVAVKDFYGDSSLRFNTVFKFHLQAWLLLCAALAFGSDRLFLRGYRTFQSRTPGWQFVWILMALHLVLAASVVTVTGTGGLGFMRTLCHEFRIEPTLNGLAHAFAQPPRGDIDKDDARVIQKLLDEQRLDWEQNRRILEVSGNPYSPHGRVSTFSGIPTLLGWGNHEGIWNRGNQKILGEINQRDRVIDQIYSSPNFASVKQFLETHGVTHVFFGSLERREYGASALRNFRKYMLVAEDRNGSPLTSGETFVFAGFRDVPIEQTQLTETPALPLASAQVVAPTDAALTDPRGVAFGPDGSLYVNNSKQGRVERFSFEGEWLGSFGNEGPGKLSAEYSGPGGIRVAPDGNIWVTDTWNYRLAVFSPPGEYLREVRLDFFGPRDIAFIGNRAVVSDTGHHRLVLFDPATGLPIKAVGKNGSGMGEFVEPVGLAVEGNTLYVADTGNARVQVFDSNLNWQRSFDVLGWEDPVWTEPYMTIDSSPSLWLTDSGKNRLQRYTLEGRLLSIHGPQLESLGNLKNGKGIASASGTLAISDTGNHRILLLPIPARDQSTGE